jgi:hypothetical protein
MQESDDAKLIDWRERIGPMLAGLEDFVAGPDTPLDLSAESLRDLEQVLLAESPPGQPPPQGLAETLGGYLGETLLTIGGGGWAWDSDSDLPVTSLDLGEVVHPMRLVVDALVWRTGKVWPTEYERIAALAAARRSEEPAWKPRRTDRPAMGAEAWDAGPGEPWLTGWLASREQKFPDWAVVTGRADELDFSPESLLTLEQVVRLRIPSRAALRESIDDDFVQGAIWYLGEVARRHRKAHWRYWPDPTGTSKNPNVGRPFVDQDDPGGGSAIPLLELESALLSDQNGVLLDRLSMFD